MKLRHQLWLAYSLLFAVVCIVSYSYITHSYEERVWNGQRNLAVSQGLTILDQIKGSYPKFPERTAGYLAYYSKRLDMRMFIADNERKVKLDSFRQIPINTVLSLKVFDEPSLPASRYQHTDLFGYVQYTLMQLQEGSPGAGYLLMIKEVNDLYGSIRSFQRLVGGILLAAVILFLFFSYLIASWFTRPMKEIIERMNRISSQNRKFEMKYGRRDEFRELIAAISAMVKQLNWYELRQRQFLSTSSHELKTPVATMQLILENLPHVRGDERMHREFLEDLAGQVGKMKRIVDDLLNVNRTVDMPLSLRPLSSGEIRRHIEEHFSLAASSKRIELQFIMEEMSLPADSEMFLRGADNLISNAIRYSPPDTVVTVRLERLGPDSAEFAVCDQGIGIREEDLPFVFEPFFRSKEGKRWEEQGSGLGLAIVKQMADKHGAEIIADSTPGQGTCMRLVFRNKIVTS
ncbi:sensor histidine kinase [Ferviditalea candida]|uniref:histidine kinase n=1 Tax=Ferviditalea candida TaxID=3108399 RepID=A0ABU5ZDW6_9BACL|nr:HAMP domain-containing sensor histidine kinase [Paenibacillaceae bacterium T2]